MPQSMHPEVRDNLMVKAMSKVSACCFCRNISCVTLRAPPTHTCGRKKSSVGSDEKEEGGSRESIVLLMSDTQKHRDGVPSTGGTAECSSCGECVTLFLQYFFRALGGSTYQNTFVSQRSLKGKKQIQVLQKGFITFQPFFEVTNCNVKFCIILN